MSHHRPSTPRERSEWGQYAEDTAAHWLERQGAQILTRNFLHRRGEIDIICQRDQQLLFVEVRSLHNTDPARAIATINPAKQRRLKIAAQAYLAQHPPAGDTDIGFLCVGISFQTDGSIRFLQQPLESF